LQLTLEVVFECWRTLWWRIQADRVLADGHGGGSGARTRYTAGGGDQGWKVWHDHFPNNTFVLLAARDLRARLDSALAGGFIVLALALDGSSSFGQDFNGTDPKPSPGGLDLVALASMLIVTIGLGS
jgi:hypothetical protein